MCVGGGGGTVCANLNARALSTIIFARIVDNASYILSLNCNFRCFKIRVLYKILYKYESFALCVYATFNAGVLSDCL